MSRCTTCVLVLNKNLNFDGVFLKCLDLNMKALEFFETSVNILQSTRRKRVKD